MANKSNNKSSQFRGSKKNRKGFNDKRDDSKMRKGKIARKSDRETNGEDFYEKGASPSMKNPNIKSERNDATWYTYSPEVLRVATAVNFNQAVGVPFSDEATPLKEADPTYKWWATSPSLMRMTWTPLPGMAINTSARNQTNAPLNLQMRSLYSLMQATVTQNLPFAAADLGIHLMFMDSIFTLWGHLQRLYYLFRVYKAMNTTVPRVFFEAYDLDPDNLFVGGYTIADYQADMLSLQQEMRRIAVPDGFDILNRHYWMSKHVFKDDDVVRAQYYMFVPHAVWTFDANGATGGELYLTKVPNFQIFGIKELINFFKTCLKSYYNDENIWNLNGYILRAFNKFWVADDFQLDGIYEPQYVPEVLMQIHNATVAGDSIVRSDDFSGDFARIYQDAQDNIVCDPAVKVPNLKSVGHLVDNRILFDVPTDTPSEGDIMVASRLIARGFPYQTQHDGYIVRLNSFGTELVNRVSVYDGVNDKIDPSHGTGESIDVRYYVNVYDEGGAGIINQPIDFIQLARLSKFNSAPMLPLIYDHETETSGNYDMGWFDYVGDIQNFVVFDKKVLSKLHDAAAMGEWYIKQ